MTHDDWMKQLHLMTMVTKLCSYFSKKLNVFWKILWPTIVWSFFFSNPPFESRCHCKLLCTGTTSKFVLQKRNLTYQRYPFDKENRRAYMSHLARPKIPMFPKIQNWRLLLPLKHVSFMWLVILNLNANQQHYNYNYNSNYKLMLIKTNWSPLEISLHPNQFWWAITKMWLQLCRQHRHSAADVVVESRSW